MTLTKAIAKNKYTYMLLFPGLIVFLVFCYAPMYGIMLAFKDFMYNKGIWGSPWNDFAHFKMLFVEQDFWLAFKNTVEISVQRIIFTFPAPIVLAIFLNELRSGTYTKVLQTIYTFPHFLSWVVLSGVILNFLSSNGVVNSILFVSGMQKQDFLANPDIIRPILYITSVWQEAGWVSIIYLASIAGINPEIYESATIDGANRLQRILYVTLPGMKSMIVIMLVLSVGGIMNANFDQIFNLGNPVVMDKIDIIDTYIYRFTFESGGDFGFSTAVGLFKNVINLILLFSADRVAKRLGESGLF